MGRSPKSQPALRHGGSVWSARRCWRARRTDCKALDWVELGLCAVTATATATVGILLSLMVWFEYGVDPALVLDAAGYPSLNAKAIFGPHTAGRGLVVIPGHGLQPERSKIIRHNAEFFDREFFDCVVFVYTDDRVWWDLSGPFVVSDPNLGGCAKVYEKGQWTHFIGLITPPMVSAAGYTSVTLLIDDVEIGQTSAELQGRTIFPHGFDPVTTIEVMDKNGIDVSSPNIYGSDFRTMARGLTWHHGAAYVTVNPTRHGGREINFLEIQLTTFRNLEIYECYHGLVDPVLNAPGWGVDVCLQPLCGGRFALMDTVAVHRGRHTFIGGIGVATESGDPAFQAMLRWFERIKDTHPNAVNLTDIWDCKYLTGAISVHRTEHMQPADHGLRGPRSPPTHASPNRTPRDPGDPGDPAPPSYDPAPPSYDLALDHNLTMRHTMPVRVEQFLSDKAKWDFCWYLSGTNATALQDRTPCGCSPGDVCQPIQFDRASREIQREWEEWATEHY